MSGVRVCMHVCVRLCNEPGPPSALLLCSQEFTHLPHQIRDLRAEVEAWRKKASDHENAAHQRATEATRLQTQLQQATDAAQAAQSATERANEAARTAEQRVSELARQLDEREGVIRRLEADVEHQRRLHEHVSLPQVAAATRPWYLLTVP